MHNARTIFTTIFVLFFIIAIGGGLFWGNLNFVKRVPAGADFVVPWKAMQNLMMQGVTPYGELTALNIQSVIYHGPLPSGQNPYPVNIPLVFLMLYLPLSWIGDLSLASAIWLSLLEASLLAVAVISIQLSRWKPGWVLLMLLLLFSAFWQPSAAMLVSGTPIILQALVIVAAVLSLEAGSDELAGALLALSLMNIEATGVVFLVFMVWIFSTGRWRVLGGIVMLSVILIIISYLLQPGWTWGFLGATLANWKLGVMPSTYSLFEAWLPGIGHRLGQILSISALTVLFLEMRAVRGQGPYWLFWTTCLAAALTPLLGLPYWPHWVVFTLPGILLVVAVMSNRWKLFGLATAIAIILSVFVLLWLAYLYSITSIFIFFYPLALTVLLYWVRWGAVRQPRLWADEIRSRG